MKTLAFIDAANLFYGGEQSLGWKIDYQRLLAYLKEKYAVRTAYYFGGVELHGFRFHYLNEDTVPVLKLEQHLRTLLKAKEEILNDANVILIGRHLQRVRFYRKLEDFGYTLRLKPVKRYEQEDGTFRRKANCDVDMAFCMMKEKEHFDRALVLSGDGDFLPVLKHLRSNGKEVLILARGPRTAREIRQFAGASFLDFTRLEHKLRFEGKK